MYCSCPLRLWLNSKIRHQYQNIMLTEESTAEVQLASRASRAIGAMFLSVFGGCWLVVWCLGVGCLGTGIILWLSAIGGLIPKLNPKDA
jgi:hypothetical protein